MRFRILPDIETSAAMQMAIDEAILIARVKKQSPGTIRFYSWKPKAITIGYFQSLKKEVDEKKAKVLGIDVIRRYTGGGAVFHDKEITYSICIGEKTAGIDIIKSYEKICGFIIKGMECLNLKAQFKPINDIIVNGKKISGNAQTRKDGIILQHGTLLLDVDVNTMFSILKIPDEKIRDKLIENARQRVTSLKQELGKDISFTQAKTALISGFKKTFKAELKEQELSEFEKAAVKKLFKQKYSTKEWNNQR